MNAHFTCMHVYASYSCFVVQKLEGDTGSPEAGIGCKLPCWFWEQNLTLLWSIKCSIFLSNHGCCIYLKSIRNRLHFLKYILERKIACFFSSFKILFSSSSQNFAFQNEYLVFKNNAEVWILDWLWFCSRLHCIW